MGILQKKRRTTGKKALAYRGKGGQNTGIPALRLGVVLDLLTPSEGHPVDRDRVLRPVPLSLLFVCQTKLTEFFAELTELAVILSEFSSP